MFCHRRHFDVMLRTSVFIYHFMNKRITDNDYIPILNNQININGIGCYIFKKKYVMSP